MISRIAPRVTFTSREQLIGYKDINDKNVSIDPISVDWMQDEDNGVTAVYLPGGREKKLRVPYETLLSKINEIRRHSRT